MSFSLSLHFLAGVKSADQCLLNSKVLSCFSGIIMSIRSFFLSTSINYLSESTTTLQTESTWSCGNAGAKHLVVKIIHLVTGSF